jgi:hypothetical protein
MPGEEHVFLSADTVEAGDDRAMGIATEFLNAITLPRMPPHRLALKVGVVYYVNERNMWSCSQMLKISFLNNGRITFCITSWFLMIHSLICVITIGGCLMGQWDVYTCNEKNLPLMDLKKP